MTFFNWEPEFDKDSTNKSSGKYPSMEYLVGEGDSSKNRISGWIWVYFVATAVATAATVGLWLYFTSRRRARRQALQIVNSR